jgi:DNA-binding protein H-NS
MTSPAMLESLDEEALQQVIRQAQELLQARQQQKRREAIEQARSILAGAGLTAKDLTAESRASSPRSRKSAAKTAPAMRAGDRYVNPANAAQSWTVGRGRVPNWFRELRDAGTLPEPSR